MEALEKKLLILGANAETYQIAKIAQEKDLCVYVTDHIKDSYAKSKVDGCFDINGMDVDEIVQVAKENDFAGIMLGVAEPLLEPYIKICRELGRPCFADKELVKICRSKDDLKNWCKENGLKVAENFFSEKFFFNIKKESLRYPMIVKPSVSRGGRGIFLCKKEAELEDCFMMARKQSDDEIVIGEEYIEGEDCVLTLLILNGSVFFVALSDRILLKNQDNLATVTYSNRYPSKYTDFFLETELSKYQKMFSDAKVQNGLVNIQMFKTRDGFYPYDSDCILNGETVSGLIKEMYGIDLVNGWLEYALTGKADLLKASVGKRRVCTKVGASVWILLKSGTIASIDGRRDVELMPEIVDCIWRLKEGDTVTAAEQYKEHSTLVRFWLVAEDEKRLGEAEEKIRKTISVKDEKGDSMICEMKWVH